MSSHGNNADRSSKQQANNSEQCDFSLTRRELLKAGAASAAVAAVTPSNALADSEPRVGYPWMVMMF